MEAMAEGAGEAVGRGPEAQDVVEGAARMGEKATKSGKKCTNC